MTAVLWSSCTGPAPSCDGLDLFGQVGCYADLAVSRHDVEACSGAVHDGVRNQCYAVAAGRLDQLDACDRIEPLSPEHIELRDVCISDIALLRRNAALCGRLDTRTLQDTCLFRIYQITGETALCADIADNGLRNLCDDTQVIIK
ncbi:MAG: hypothetical protein KJO54_10310 [Gammaproteobacteria bacterium]|nr:hypothetical protein [Gammaproteobacteria bacterium]NNF62117.1 hypothetical protein [Gammaproteobacteria bacterium]NNM20501.1 hypothetical protein [Gammaproteobacteria bacterium]